MTGDADCCARAESGHAVAVPPRSLMNWRRVIASPEACDKAIVAVQTRPGKGQTDVRFGSEADMYSARAHVRFTPESGHVQCTRPCLLWAKSGLMQRSKEDRYSITSSTRASSVGGIVRPRAFAVVRLRTRSNLVGCSTGMSPGFAPRRILSTISAVRLHCSRKFAP